jgi:hypothetical protein
MCRVSACTSGERYAKRHRAAVAEGIVVVGIPAGIHAVVFGMEKLEETMREVHADGSS